MRELLGRNWRRATLIAAIPVAMVSKFVALFALPDYYFWDSNLYVAATLFDGNALPSDFVSSMDPGEYRKFYRNFSAFYEDVYSSDDQTRQFTIEFYRTINIFGFDSTAQWSVFMGVIGTVLLMTVAWHSVHISLPQSAFFLSSVGLLNIFAFGITKETIQICFFILMIAFMMIVMRILRRYDIAVLPMQLSCLVAASMVLALEGIVFRGYYMIMIPLMFVALLLLSMLKKHDAPLAISPLIVFAIMSTALCIMLVCGTLLFPYINGALTWMKGNVLARDGQVASSTLIMDLLPGYGLAGAVANYPLDALRMLFPVELLFKQPMSASYVLFFLFQVFVDVMLVLAIRTSQRQGADSGASADIGSVSALCVVLAFMTVSFLFEPDFGSWTRHESAAFPLLWMAFSTVRRSQCQVCRQETE
ncbi:hypothetical protein [Bifidobacterium tissieri]|uniref:Transmembrane protein n=1 Tax=Bifidobacterium tissieri TaxID=1630162 RepID=A0A5M9ZWL7_9BIFI|nr:hypothetical protein [Bifidobacterium tissieri]KAA8829304.1 hypothetical protein EMO89_08410 [Bifidobacterium tissieri]KAA8831908.1 hypothetical protein EM849_06625 [Bifidobacterium tissieri]